MKLYVSAFQDSAVLCELLKYLMKTSKWGSYLKKPNKPEPKQNPPTPQGQGMTLMRSLFGIICFVTHDLHD